MTAVKPPVKRPPAKPATRITPPAPHITPLINFLTLGPWPTMTPLAPSDIGIGRRAVCEGSIEVLRLNAEMVIVINKDRLSKIEICFLMIRRLLV
jgi:hypothetical protein